MPRSNSPESPSPVRVWDLPLRLFHWALVVCVVGAFVTIQVGGNWVVWHFRFGYCALALVIFRVLWGLFGSRYARFGSFLFGPGSVLKYLKKAPDAPHTAGHNPLGSLSVFAMLGFVLLQATMGLFANDDIASEGPLVKFISKELSDSITGWHHRGEWLLVLLVGTHLAAIAYYALFRRKNLVRPMLSGDKIPGIDEGASASTAPARDDAGMRLFALVLLCLSGGLVYWITSL
jgi:cytochrome b